MFESWRLLAEPVLWQLGLEGSPHSNIISEASRRQVT